MGEEGRTGRGLRTTASPWRSCKRSRAAVTSSLVPSPPARDEEQGLAILNRRLELPVGAREHRRLPWRQLIGLEPACEQHGASAFATQLALELARSDRRNRIERAQSEKVEALHLLAVEPELARGERGEERARVVDLQQATWSRACRRESS